jgi:selenocysteine lyase/cysteine desulfurase
VKLYCCNHLKNHLSTVSMNIEGLDPGNVGIMLDVDHNVATRTGLHCAPLVHQQLDTIALHGSVRFSIGAFNTEADIDAATEGVRQIARWSRERQPRRSADIPVHA